MLPTDCLMIALDAHMFSHQGYGCGTKDQGPKAGGSGAWGLAAFGPGAMVSGSKIHKKNILFILIHF